MTPAVATKVTMVSNQIIVLCPLYSDLEMDDLPQDHRTYDLQNKRGAQHHRPLRIVEKDGDILRIQEAEDPQHGDRQRDQDARGEAALRGSNLHVAVDAEAIANHSRQPVEDLGQIASGLLLNHQRRNEETDVDNRHTVGEIEQ